ncbi:MAG: ROK family protein [Candidatus Omnitrophica bacterium]|nr:ROK family protein [Candidatus Omnitrophota bacterium]
MKNLVLGIDVGGTNIKLGIVDDNGRILSRSSIPTKSYNRNRNDLIKAIFAEVRRLLGEAKIAFSKLKGIGIGLPGQIDPDKGQVIFLPNIPGWENVSLCKIFEKEFNVPTLIENDVNMITLGEWRFGSGKGKNDLLCMTLGTGVGGGLILDGQLYRGARFVAGEIGHIPLNEQGPACSCGGYGCLERYVGNRVLLKKIVQIFGDKELTIPAVNKLAQQGNKKALKFFEETATHLGNGLVGVVNLLNPPLIIIGGGVSHNHKFLFPTIRKVIQARAMKVQKEILKIIHAKLGDDAGILGARVLISENLRKRK